MENKVSFQSKDRLNLIGVWNYPVNKSDRVIILAHGITVDKEEDGIFTNLAKKLADNGYNVFRFDFRGHGESEGKPIDMTINGEIVDLDAAVEYVKKAGYKNIGLLGASFGGGISVLYTAKNQNKIKALCLWNPCLNYDHCFLNPTLPWIADRKSHMKKEIEEQGWTTLGSRKYVVGKNLWEEMKTFFPYKELTKIKIPTVALHDKNDTYVSYEDSEKYLRGVGELITLSGGGHGFHNSPYDQEAIKTTLQFFNKYL